MGSENELEFIKREELARIKRTRHKVAAELADSEQARLKELHWMRCPKCGMELAEIEYRGARVDSCFSCGGMFLDRGEAETVASWEDPGWLQKYLGELFGSDK